jgi:uncharacterized protein (DUF849 family)
MKPLPRIMVAPNGARLTKKDHPNVPVTIPEIVQTTLDCIAVGADGLHAHVRDESQQHVLDTGLYQELLAELATKVPEKFMLQITTEAMGRYTPAAQRALVEEVRPGAVSIAVREMTAGEDERTLRRFYNDCHEAGIAVQHILYDVADVGALAGMVASGTVPADGLQALIVLGRYSAGQTSSVLDLGAPAAALLSTLPDVDWAVCAFGAYETDCLLAARSLGGKARIGFENNRMNQDLSCASSNAERVAELAEAMGVARAA